MPMDATTGWIEADITVNGQTLNFAESMAVRVAISTFRMTLADRAIRHGLGERLSANYDRHLANVERLMRERS
jgi:hypothetical protein